MSRQQTNEDAAAAPTSARSTRTVRALTRTDLVSAGLVFLVTVVLGSLVRTEIVPTDPWRYLDVARRFPHGTDWIPLGYARYGQVLPAAVIERIFRWGELSYLVLPIASGAVLAACTYLVAARWWNPLAGWLAAALLVTNWTVFLNLSRYYPDLSSLAQIMLALVLALTVRYRVQEGRGRTAWLLVAVGFLLGWSFETRELSLFYWPFVAAVLWQAGQVLRHLVLVTLGGLFWVVLDIGLSWGLYGNPLLKLFIFTQADLSRSGVPADQAAAGGLVGQPRWEYPLMIPRLLAEQSFSDGLPTTSFWFLVLLALAALGVVVRNGWVRFAALMHVVIYGLFVGVSGGFAPSRPLNRIDVTRYWTQLVPPMSLAVAGTVVVLGGWALRSASRRAVTVATVLTAVLVAVGPGVSLAREAARTPTMVFNSGSGLTQVAEYLGAQHGNHDKVRVWSDGHTLRLLAIHAWNDVGTERRFRPTLLSLWTTSVPKPGDYVIITHAKTQNCDFCRSSIVTQRLAEKPEIPATWQPVLVTDGEGLTLYRVAP